MGGLTARFLNLKMNVKAAVPSRHLTLLLAIGFLDLVSTAMLHSRGLIIEANPLMRYFIEQSEWLFVIVKGSTLILGWLVLSWYAKIHAKFVEQCCIWGSVAYVAVWLGWFLVASARQI